MASQKYDSVIVLLTSLVYSFYCLVNIYFINGFINPLGYSPFDMVEFDPNLAAKKCTTARNPAIKIKFDLVCFINPINFL